MAYRVKVEDQFSAAHRIQEIGGKCENLHGHNWKVSVSIQADKLSQHGLVTDFRKLKTQLKKILKEMDHSYLNEIPSFKKINPTSENIAKYIYDNLSKKINNERIKVKSIEVAESENSKASYEG
jgi:6-pyruvoyltetrahydropterin/6-carboxytetrahydropterin synthase